MRGKRVLMMKMMLQLLLQQQQPMRTCCSAAATSASPSLTLLSTRPHAQCDIVMVVLQRRK